MIKSLTSLRGVFILFIFFHHCLNIYPGGGSMAVAFFFVLGGFSMTLGYKDRVLNPEFSYRQYITRRCIRFFPLHWLCLLAALPMALMSFHWKQIPLFFINAALLQTLVPDEGVFFSFNSVSWYLADTLIFAVLFPVLVKWISKASTNGKIGILIMIAIAYIITTILTPTGKWHYMLYISPYIRLTDFVLGIFLAMVYSKMRERLEYNKVMKNGLISVLLIFSIIVLMVFESCLLQRPYRLIAPLYWPLIALLVLTASLSTGNGGGKLLENKYLQHLGELSFTIFLTHQLIIRYSTFVFNKFHIDQPVIFVVTTLLLTLLVSDVVNRYILNPITQWLTKKIQPSMTARS